MKDDLDGNGRQQLADCHEYRPTLFAPGYSCDSRSPSPAERPGRLPVGLFLQGVLTPSMFMPMVDVRIVRMFVAHANVTMAVGVRLLRPLARLVVVLMMIVVNVIVFMF